MKCRLIITLVLAAVLIFSGTLAGRDIETVEKNVPGDSEVKKVNLETDIGCANITLSTHDKGDMFTSEVRYDTDRVEVDFEYEKQKTAADIFVLSEQASRRLDLDTDDCRWDISLSREYVWDIKLDIGFAECELDLSGLPMDRFELDIGASECQIVFNEPNPEQLRRMEIDAGAGDLEFIGLGYANFEHLSFDGGAGDFTLDFTGLTEGFHTAEIDVGVGDARVELPKGLPVRIETGGSWLNSIKVRGRELEEIDDGVYETEDFEDSDYGLEITLDLGIGQATIGWAGEPGTILSVRSSSRHIQIIDDCEHGGIYRLPALPALPALPELPELPDLPELSELPTLQEWEPLPALPALPELPELPRKAHRVLE
jgi:hypothetical protein